jgi:hypothetical protein
VYNACTSGRANCREFAAKICKLTAVCGALVEPDAAEEAEDSAEEADTAAEEAEDASAPAELLELGADCAQAARLTIIARHTNADTIATKNLVLRFFITYLFLFPEQSQAPAPAISFVPNNITIQEYLQSLLLRITLHCYNPDSPDQIPCSDSPPDSLLQKPKEELRILLPDWRKALESICYSTTTIGSATRSVHSF